MKTHSSTDARARDREKARAIVVQQVTVARQSSTKTETPVTRDVGVGRRLEVCDVISLASLTFRQEDKQHQHLEKREMHGAESMCLPIQINGITMGPALVDQGASRSVMRLSAYKRFIRQHGPGGPRLIPKTNMYVIGSTGEKIPVVGRFIAQVGYSYHGPHNHLGGTPIARTLIYVVQDTAEKDIICDMVIGRATIANSSYSCVDTTGAGALISHDQERHTVIPCSKCSFYEDANKKRQLRLEPSTGVEEPESTVDSYLHRVSNLHAIVNSRERLTADEKAHLHSYLLTHLDSFQCADERATAGAEAPSDEKELQETRENMREHPYVFNENEEVRLCHLMSELDKSMPRSPEERAIVTELLTTFVPDVVQKTEHIQQKKNEYNETSEELDEIEFPFTPPTQKLDTPEYHAAKESKIADSVRANVHLDERQQQELISVLIKFSDRFSMNGENMERTASVHHEINTNDRHPFRERLRQYSPAVQEIISKEVEKMLKEGVIVESKSPYASNLLLVRKPDASSEGGVKNRVCASFVRLNSDTEKDSYPLPNIQYIFDRIGRSKWFTTMDLLSGFWQVMIKPEHRHKTAFITMRGLYEFVVMPFGLCNAPATFQRLMDAVVKPEYRAFIETYIDDLMTHSSSFEEHLRHLEVLLTALREHKLVVKLSKCKFAQQEVKFLGHVVSHKAIKTNPEAVEAIKKWQRPLGGGKKAVTAIRGFLGMAGWYRKFIPHFADIAKPLVHLTKNDVDWNWTTECQTAFERLRDALTTSPVLAVADPNKNYILHTDASSHAMGAILQQEDAEGNKHPIAYASKTFNDAQKNYDTTEREALAIVWALDHFNTYCEGHKYTLLTDHKALSYIRTNKDNNKRITRWQLLLQHYQLDIDYVKGKDNHAADLLSRPAMEQRIELNLNVMSHARSSLDEYEVECIVDKRPSERKANDTEYRVRWKGFTEDDDTWEPSANVAGAAELIVDFERRRKTNAQTTVKDDESLDVRVYECVECDERFANQSTLHIHRYREHKIDVPSGMLTELDVNVEPEVFRRLQRQEEQFRCVFNTDLGERCDVPLNKYERRTLMNHEFVVSDSGLLYMMDSSATRSRMRAHSQLRLCIPKTERARLMRDYHHSAAHPGIVHMYDLLREKVWWPSMKKDIFKYVSECHECQINKNEKMKTLTRPMTIPTKPWSHIAIDHVGPFPMSNNGHKYILVIVDRFTRYAEAFAVPDTSARTSAEVIVSHIICRYGMFDVLLSDRGGGFMSEIFRHVMALFGVKQLRTTAYHPKSNGGVERFNKTLKRALKLWVNKQHTDWDVLLPFALFAYNTAVHSTMKETPFYLNFARQARTVTDLLTDNDILQRKTVHAYAHEVIEKLRTVHEQVRDILQSINDERQQAIHAEAEGTGRIAAGDSVYLYDETTPVNRSKKFIKRWRGPFIVTKIHDNGTSVILKGEGESLVSNDRLRKVTEGCETIEELHQQDLDLATDELRAINESIVAMNERKQRLQTIVDVSKFAGSVAKASGNGSKPSQQLRAIEYDDETGQEHEASADDEDEIILNGLRIDHSVVMLF